MRYKKYGTQQNTERYVRLYPEENKESKEITLQVTDGCNMACTYCYQHNKAHHQISLSDIKTFAEGCSNDCTGGCTGTCNATCEGSCTGACNVGCVGNTTTTLYSNLTLTIKMESNNINDIATFIYNEAARRSASPTSVSTSVGEKVTAAKIATMISNLSRAGQTASYSASAGSKSLRTLGQDLIDKAKKAYEQIVPT